MSTRKGKVEFLNDLIIEAKQVALDSMEFSKSINSWLLCIYFLFNYLCKTKAKKDLEDKDYVAQNIGNSHVILFQFYI